MARPKSTASPRGRELQQDRARVTRDKLIRGASAVFWTKGYHAAQTPEIAAAAGVSVGTFYRYFRDKRDVLLEIARRELGAAHEEVLALLTPDRFLGKGRRAAMAAVVHILIAAVVRHPERHKLFLEMALRDEEFAAIRRPYDDRTRDILAQIIQAVCPRDRVADPQATAYMLHTALTECALHLAGLHGPRPMGRERAIAALTEMADYALFGPRR